MVALADKRHIIYQRHMRSFPVKLVEKHPISRPSMSLVKGNFMELSIPQRSTKGCVTMILCEKKGHRYG